MTVIQGANLALRFLLELCALGALAYWGFKTGRGPVAKAGLGLGAPLVAAVVWGTFVAPAAPVAAPGALRFVLELAVFGSAVVALYFAGRPTLAWTLGSVYVINRVLMFVWGQ